MKSVHIEESLDMSWLRVITDQLHLAQSDEILLAAAALPGTTGFDLHPPFERVVVTHLFYLPVDRALTMSVEAFSSKTSLPVDVSSFFYFPRDL